MPQVGRNDPCPCGSGKKYKRCCLTTGVSRQVPKLATLDEALNAFSSGEVPDYVGFCQWFQRECETRRAAGALDASPVDSTSQAVERLLHLLKQGDGNTLDAAQLKHLKLLLGVFEQRERGHEFIQALLADDNFEIPLNKATPAVLRFRLHKAIREGEEREAMRVLGALERLEDVHDRGEIAFLGALCEFKANRFEEALTWASRVTGDAVDSPKARQIELLAHAMLGDAKNVRALLESIGPCGLSPAQVQRAVMLLLKQADVSSEEQETLQTLWQRVPKMNASEDPERQAFVQDLNRIASSFSNRLRSAWTAETLQGRTAENAFELLSRIMPEDPQLRRGAAALYAVGILEPLLVELAHGGSGWGVLAAMIQPVEKPRADFALSCYETMAALEEHQILCDSVELLGDAIERFQHKQRRQLLTLLLGSQVLLGRSGAELTIERLRRLGIDPAPTISSAAFDRVAATLGPMARLAWTAASADLDIALSNDHRWTDAGMLSLGLFRVLELEFNRRLFVPAIRSLSIDKIDAAESDLDDEARSRWNRTLPELRAVQRGTKAGFEIGTMHFLLGKCRRAGDASDRAIRAVLRDMLADRLTESGRQMLNTGSIASFISDQPRERFRNPGAHARFVSLKQATECREHVANGLSALDAWLLPSAN
jgi:hypothetical protein